MSRPIALLVLLSLPAVGCGREPASNQTAPRGSTTEARPERKAAEPLPDIVRVRLETDMGAIVVALDAKRAPLTAANFVRYAEDGKFDGTTFYRAARTPGSPAGEGARGFIQGGIRRDYRRMHPPVAHEPTSETGLRHEAGTISMARTDPGNAMGEFFITANRMPAMDARGGEPGYAAFGRVVEGMDVVRRILAAPTAADAGRGAMRGQMLEAPVRIVRAVRVD
ncbi:MAG TPA: peptidylprolyl isomerase [Allosphingosinicella sp.]|jgi:peptidyl-prolyl cis-trans isomerase A (cyclophilin A)